MTQPGRYDIVIQQGADWEKSFQFFSSNGVGLNLTGATVEAELWTEFKRLKLADFIVTYTNRSAGQFKLSLSDAVTYALPSSGFYDIKVTDAAGFSSYWVRGQAVVETGYTE